VPCSADQPVTRDPQNPLHDAAFALAHDGCDSCRQIGLALRQHASGRTKAVRTAPNPHLSLTTSPCGRGVRDAVCEAPQRGALGRFSARAASLVRRMGRSDVRRDARQALARVPTSPCRRHPSPRRSGRSGESGRSGAQTTQIVICIARPTRPTRRTRPPRCAFVTAPPVEDRIAPVRRARDHVTIRIADKRLAREVEAVLLSHTIA
jgi:hypothetical protein